MTIMFPTESDEQDIYDYIATIKLQGLAKDDDSLRELIEIIVDHLRFRLGKKPPKRYMTYKEPRRANRTAY